MAGALELSSCSLVAKVLSETEATEEKGAWVSKSSNESHRRHQVLSRRWYVPEESAMFVVTLFKVGSSLGCCSPASCSGFALELEISVAVEPASLSPFVMLSFTSFTSDRGSVGKGDGSLGAVVVAGTDRAAAAAAAAAACRFTYGKGMAGTTGFEEDPDLLPPGRRGFAVPLKGAIASIDRVEGFGGDEVDTVVWGVEKSAPDVDKE